MIDTLLETIKKQRLAWSWAVVIGLFLVVIGHAPILPVITGCLLAVGISLMRAWPRVSTKAAVRGTR
jgi:hypothetical protein